ncbi:DNA cross-link repair protein PSO2/SNM1 [Sporothrix curviconia]|uniref:DNA cross-link repair protein PSO2/SNM1 n=1 Tax=Sporothrix curviconia TaxID=1260050 RepID=A0ABP0B4X8_9PEZI
MVPTPTRQRPRPAPRPSAGPKQRSITSMTSAKSTTTTTAALHKLASSPAKGPPNKSILSFFKKVPPPEESMFVAASGGGAVLKHMSSQEQQTQTTETEETAETAQTADSILEETVEDEFRFNECVVAVKRRRLSEEPVGRRNTPPSATSSKQAQKPARGPFVDDSDDSDGDEDDRNYKNDTRTSSLPLPTTHSDAHITLSPRRLQTHTSFDETFLKTPLPDKALLEDEKSQDTDAKNDDKETEFTFDDADFDFAGLDNDDNDDDGDDDDFAGEEFRERRYMEAQAQLEACEVVAAANGLSGEAVDECPICGASLSGNTPDQATVHVNACLDGLGGGPGGGPAAEKRPEKGDETEAAGKTTVPTAKIAQTASPPAEIAVSGLSKRFLRTAQPRPGQANPVAFGGASASAAGASAAGSSAFAKLMSGKAEDAAWATAAASEMAARGRPAYERTCPFYKIMPGFSICVDAFRYGAVEGCRAYFLSHFHSDHYIGLTAKWCHGPIYCSQVTASLVRSQLGTAAQYVVALEFNAAPFEVPGTPGVRVTMIPANHCPGSSLFLFERTATVTATAAPGGRTQRILHCGDFRACQAHVEHPQLRPDVLDGSTNKVRQQRIDVCYLDTTYLNPRYAFPPQDQVIAACASLCSTLDQSLRAGREGEWDRALRRRESNNDGSGNVKDFFAAKEAGKDAAAEAADEGPTTKNALSVLGKPSPKRNCRLLVVCGTYSIGKERICKAIAQALGSKIYAAPHKIKIVAQLGDPELTALMTSDPTQAQVHMQMLMELRAETLAEYLEGYRQHFSHIVGFRPSGWNYRPQGQGQSVVANLPPSTLATTTLLHGPAWRTHFGPRDLVPQRGSTSHALCLGVPYSEHSSFRELALFLLSLRIDRVVPTVNVGSDVSRRRMKAWTDRWLAERRRGGVVQTRRGREDEKEEKDESGAKERLWEGKDGQGGVAYW